MVDLVHADTTCHGSIRNNLFPCNKFWKLTQFSAANTKFGVNIISWNPLILTNSKCNVTHRKIGHIILSSSNQTYRNIGSVLLVYATAIPCFLFLDMTFACLPKTRSNQRCLAFLLISIDVWTINVHHQTFNLSLNIVESIIVYRMKSNTTFISASRFTATESTSPFPIINNCLHKLFYIFVYITGIRIPSYLSR